MDAASHLLRRSRLRSFVAGAGHVLSPDARAANENGSAELEERYNPDLTYNTNISDEAVGTSTVKVTTTATAKATSTAAATTTRAAAKAATVGTSKATTVTTAVTTSKAADYVTKTTATTSSSSKTTSSSATSTAATSTKITSTTSTTSTTSSTPTSTTHSTTSTSTSTTSSTPTVLTITSDNAVASTTSSSAKTSATAAASSGSTTTGMSTGSVVGVVFGVVAGLIVLGGLIGWLYRKYTSRSSTKSPWSKLNDDITPFPTSFEKNGGGDIYGSTNSAPVIGSRRALALARANAFNNDGSLRPDSEVYAGDNRAGLGAGGMSFSPYPTLAQPSGVYGLDPHGRPYNPHAGRTPMDHTLDAQYDDDPYQYSVANTRQLVGPPAPMPTAMPMGRPSPPSNDNEFAHAEDFADIPEPYTPGLVYADGAPITPVYESNNPSWPNEKQRAQVQAPTVNVEPVVTPPSSSVMRMPLPTFAPLSPLSTSFNLNRQSQPLAMYEDEQSQQKRMYGEVAQTAGIDEPTTPHTAAPTSEEGTAPIHSSLPTLVSMPRLPELSLAPPQPYQHGQPLSPLNEVPTPLSTSTVPPNPFESINMHVPPYRQEGLAPPYSAHSSSAGTTGSFPSPAYPPPSPGGMSVPGSVTDSPRRWSGTTTRGAPGAGAPGRVVSAYDDEDAYGGI